MTEIYEPREDTFLILKQIKYHATGDVLDMGTGSGVLAIAAAKAADYVIGVDVNEDALEYARAKAEEFELENVEFINSDLFSYLPSIEMRAINYTQRVLHVRRGARSARFCRHDTASQWTVTEAKPSMCRRPRPVLRPTRTAVVGGLWARMLPYSIFCAPL